MSGSPSRSSLALTRLDYFFASLCFVWPLHHLQNFLSSIFFVTSFLFLRDQ